MNFNSLLQVTSRALQAVELQLLSTPEADYLIAIKNQLKFIITKAALGLDPIVELTTDELDKNRVFNFGIISSRELTSPKQLKLKALIDVVAEELDS